MKDRFNSFAELARHRKEGKDFTVFTRKAANSDIAIVAPHGGMIEPGTSEIAQTAAGQDHSLYIFDGRAATSDEAFEDLHITSTRFDEPRCLAIITPSKTTITIHGCREKEPLVYIGGLDQPLGKKLCDAFNKAGIKALNENHRFPAKSPDNICNKNKTSQGVQLEFSSGLRDDPALRTKCAGIIRTCLTA
jgi:phage replication-related protein YjqB (UPF0714/DUF867 family)